MKRYLELQLIRLKQVNSKIIPRMIANELKELLKSKSILMSKDFYVTIDYPYYNHTMYEIDYKESRTSGSKRLIASSIAISTVLYLSHECMEDILDRSENQTLVHDEQVRLVYSNLISDIKALIEALTTVE